MKKLIIVLLACLAPGCEDETINLEGDLKYGTSFGECIGYCLTEASLDETNFVVLQKSWDTGKESKQFEKTLSTEEVQAIYDGIDLDKFAQLPETIGCPDCADGGAEWLELVIDGESKRVTFEYHEDIEGINPAIVKLRSLVEGLTADQ